MAEAMQEMNCASCIWWKRFGAPLSAAARNGKPSEDIGTCHVRPPTVAPTPHFAAGMFPETHASRFCGEWMDEWPTDGGGGESLTVPRIETTPQLRSVA